VNSVFEDAPCRNASIPEGISFIDCWAEAAGIVDKTSKTMTRKRGIGIQTPQ
jgi:hypothetical protein